MSTEQQQQQQPSRRQPNASRRYTPVHAQGHAEATDPYPGGNAAETTGHSPSEFEMPPPATASQPRQRGRDVDEAQERCAARRCGGCGGVERVPHTPHAPASSDSLRMHNVGVDALHFVSRSGRRRSRTIVLARCGSGCRRPFGPWLRSRSSGPAGSCGAPPRRKRVPEKRVGARVPSAAQARRCPSEQRRSLPLSPLPTRRRDSESPKSPSRCAAYAIPVSSSTPNRRPWVQTDGWRTGDWGIQEGGRGWQTSDAKGIIAGATATAMTPQNPDADRVGICGHSAGLGRPRRAPRPASVRAARELSGSSSPIPNLRCGGVWLQSSQVGRVAARWRRRSVQSCRGQLRCTYVRTCRPIRTRETQLLERFQSGPAFRSPTLAGWSWQWPWAAGPRSAGAGGLPPSLLGQPSRTLSQKIAREGMGRVGRKELAGVLAAARREATGTVRNVPSTLPSRERRRRTGGAARTSPPCYAVDRLGAQNEGWSVA